MSKKSYKIISLIFLIGLPFFVISSVGAKGDFKLINFFEMSKSELLKIQDKFLEEYKVFQSKNLKLDMSRGKPGADQLDLSMDLLNSLNSQSNYISEDGMDCRNYGGLDGIVEMKEFIADATELRSEDFIIGGNSSLNLMFDTILCFMTHGVGGGCEPWIKQGKIKFLCPAPGYDRHFAITEYFGMELIYVTMTPEGPDMNFIEEIIKDSSVKGIWCVPKYSNPQGITYSDETVQRFAKLKPAAKDFRIFWDNAYFVHDLNDESVPLLNLMTECENYGNEELPIMFFSTSKITFPGAGVAFMACRGESLKKLKKHFSMQTVGFDKLNQLRHFYFLKNKENLLAHMKKHRKILKPKFDLVISYLKNEFEDNPIVKWTPPKGGYFISIDVLNGCAKRVVELCKNAGIVLTSAGSTYPYGKDPFDSTIRIAPTFPALEELGLAMKLFCLCTKIAVAEKIIENK